MNECYLALQGCGFAALLAPSRQRARVCDSSFNYALTFALFRLSMRLSCAKIALRPYEPEENRMEFARAKRGKHTVLARSAPTSYWLMIRARQSALRSLLDLSK